MGIIAACAPTLRPGWRWLLEKMEGRGSHKGHTMLTDEVHLRPYGGGVPTSISTVTSKHKTHATDLKFADTLQPPLPLIHKTTQVDVEVGGESQTLRGF